MPWASSTHTLSIVDGLMVKSFVDSARGESQREWDGLTLLSRRAPGLAPEPISHGPSTPSITMTVVSGRPLAGELTEATIDAIASALHRMMTVATASDLAVLPGIIGSDALRRRADARLGQGEIPSVVADVVSG